MAVGLCMGTSVWAGTRTITYDFKTAAASGGITESSLTKGSSAGTNNSTAIYYPTELTSELGNRFAFQYREKNSNTNVWAVEKGRNGLWVNCASGIDDYFSILNLKEGDKITITIATGKIKFSATVNAKTSEDVTPDAWSYVTSDEEYTIKSDGQLDLQAMKYQNGGNAHMAISKIVIVTSDDEVIETAPTVAVTGANGGNRTVTITGYNTSADNATKTYYTLNGTTPTSSSNLYSAPFTVSTTDDTDDDGIVVVKAISYKDGDTSIESEVTTLNVTGVGTTLTLNAPTITLSAMTENTGVYNPTYSFSSNQSSIIGNPAATLTYSFAGGAATAGTSYTATTTGTLTVTASAAGYTSAQSEITVSKVGFILTDNINVVDFYGDYAGNGNKEWPTGLDYELIPRVTFSPINNEQGCTYRTTHSPNVYNALYARNKAFTATCSGLTEDEIVVFGDYQNNKYAPATSTANTTSVSKDGSLKYYSLYVQPTLTQSITVSSAEWKTLCSPYSLDFTSVTGLTAYIATGATGTLVNLTPVKKVPAGTGILLKGTANTYYVPVIAESAATDDVSANKLVGVVANKTKDAESIYVLMNDATYGVGFYQNENAFTVGANTAYLPANFYEGGVGTARSFFSLWNDGETTSISEKVKVNSEEFATAPVFNLKGQRVAQPAKGLYIVGGKKVVMK